MPEDIEDRDIGDRVREKAAERIVQMNKWLENDKWVKDWLKENEEWLKNQDRLDKDKKWLKGWLEGEDVEPADLSPEDKLGITIKKAQEELEGVKDERILRHYVYAAHGEGTRSHYKDHEKVKEAAGHIGEYLTDKQFFYKVIHNKAFDQFIENIGSPENILFPQELAEEIESPDSLKKEMDEDEINQFKLAKVRAAKKKAQQGDKKFSEKLEKRIEELEEEFS